MRALIVSDHYPPLSGGAERQTQRLAARLAALGADVAVAAPWLPGMPTASDDGGVTVHRIRQVRNLLRRGGSEGAVQHAPPYPDPVMAWTLRRLIRDFRPDVVHSHGWITYSAAVALAGLSVPLLVTSRDYGYFCANRTLLRDGTPCAGPAPSKCLGCAARFYGRPKGWASALGVRAGAPLIRRRAAAFHHVSSFVEGVMQAHFQHGRPSAALHAVIPSFRDEADHGPPEDSADVLARLPDEPFVLFIGEFRTVKGIDVLLEAHGRLREPPPLVLVGTYSWDGPSSFPPSVTVLTRLPHADVLRVCERAAFAVMPSLWPEPFGSVVHEAMSRGKAVIGTEPGGHTDMILDGVTGFLVPRGDAHALAQAMQRLVDDPALRARMGEAALERAQLFSADVVVPRFVELYETMIAGRSRASST
jgi:glycosyltransferase involved in cell wall biosynthesis